MKGTYISEKTGLGERYDSSYELERFKALDASPLVVTWTKQHGIKISYRLLGKGHVYVPDIYVIYHDGRVFLEEVKGHIWNPAKLVSKNVMAMSYCVRKKWTFRIIFKDGLKTVE